MKTPGYIFFILLTGLTFKNMYAQVNPTQGIEQGKAGTAYNLNSLVTCVIPHRNAYEILAERWPSVSTNSDLPPKCLKLAQSVRRTWQDEDEKNINKIINQFCSYNNGWAEYVPGTCQAGGPPPICPANHWYHDINAARKQYKEEANKILEERAKTLRGATCNCYGSELNSMFESENNTILKSVSTAADIPSDGSETMKVPCLNIPGKEPCPPGYKCKEGWCIAESEGQKNAQVLKKYGKEKSIDFVKDKGKDIIGNYSSVMHKAFKVFENPWIKAGFEALTPSEMSTNIDGYKNSAGHLKENFDRFYQLLLELNRFYNNKAPARGKQLIVDDINNTKTAMNENFILMDQFYRGIKIEKELFKCKDCCENAYDSYNKQMGYYYLIFNSVSY